jgi:hypothetical protein
MAYNEENGTVIYRSRTRPAVVMGRPAFAEKLRPGKQGRRRMHAKTKRNFEIFSAQDFIAAITQHPPSLKLRRTSIPEWVACPVPCSKNSGTRDYTIEPVLEDGRYFDEAISLRPSGYARRVAG